MKKRIRLLSIILSLSLALSGCSNSKTEEDKHIPLTIVEDTCEDPTREETEPANVEILEKTEAVNPGSTYKYLDYFDNITYTYNGEEFYLSDKELDNIIEIGNTTKWVNHDNVSTDAYQVFESIKRNSDALLSKRDDLQSCFIDDDNDNQNFKIFFEGTLYHILSSYCTNETNDLKEDFCKFNDLAICCGDLNKILDSDDVESGLLGYYDEKTNAIILDTKGIYELCDILYTWYGYGEHSYANLYDVIMSTLTHEMNHARQHSCDCRINAGQEYSNIGFYNEYVPGILESSAESSIYNIQDYLSEYILECNSYDFTYKSERDFECFIILLGLLHNDTEDYYNSIYDSNINKLYEFTGCENREDIKRLYHILYNIDGLMVRNDLIFDIGGDSVNSYDIERLVGNEFSIEVLNIFTEDLIRYISSHNDISDLDSMILFIMAENLSLNHTSYIEYEEGESALTKYDQDLVNDINDTRIHFENFIKDYYGLTDDELYLINLRASSVLNSKEEFLYDVCDEETIKYREKLDSLIERFPLISAIFDGSKSNSFTYQLVYSINGIDYESH